MSNSKNRTLEKYIDSLTLEEKTYIVRGFDSKALEEAATSLLKDEKDEETRRNLEFIRDMAADGMTGKQYAEMLLEIREREQKRSS